MKRREMLGACLGGGAPSGPRRLGAEFWQLAVYCSEQAVGNPTGVVFPTTELAAAECLKIAASLGHPDTVFLTPTTDPFVWNARACSPTEELSLCTQGLIAAFRVIERKSRSCTPLSIRFSTPRGLVEVKSGPGAELAWLSTTYRIVGEGITPGFLRPSEGTLLVDTGRLRLVREFTNLDELERLRLNPDEIFAFCRGRNISGICLFAKTGPRSARLRVFTTSLDGREDASTGGAAMAILPALLHRQAISRTAAREVWTIQQGSGPEHRQGTLYTRLAVGESRISVGGRHRMVATGHLLPA